MSKKSCSDTKEEKQPIKVSHSELESCRTVDLACHMACGVGVIITGAMGIFLNPYCLVPTALVGLLWVVSWKPCTPGKSRFFSRNS